MSERRTGATDAQIEAAARSWWGVANSNDPGSWKEWEEFRSYLIAEHANEASYLVRPDQRIVDVADLRTILMDYVSADDPLTDDSPLLARLREAIGDE